MENRPNGSWRIGLAKAGFVALGCAGAGAAYAAATPTEVGFGPHDASIEITMDDRATVDLGPLGSAVMPDVFPAGLGARLTVHGIDSSTRTSPTDAIDEVMAQYGQTIADPALTIQSIRETVTDRIEADARNMAIFGLAAAGLGALASRNMSAQRRQAISEAAAPSDSPYWKHWRAAGLIGVTLAATTHASALPSQNKEPRPVVAVFNNTPLEGLEVEGKLLRLAVETAAPRALSYYREVQDFYNTVRQNFLNEFERQKIADDLPSGDAIVLIQHISDNHCNISMNRVHGAVAEAFDVGLTIDSGDMTMSGTDAESFCVDSEAAAIDNQIVFIRGNHDSEDTVEQAQDNDMITIDRAETEDINGLSILGMGDPRRSAFGQGTAYTSEERVSDHAEMVEEAACEADNPPDIIVTHSAAAAEQAMEAGCASLSLSGHTHQTSGPNSLNASGAYQFTIGSSGGAAEGGITLGNLQATAEEAIFVYDKEQHQLLGYYLITAHPDMSVTISDYITMPSLPAAATEDSGEAAPAAIILPGEN